MTKTKNALFSIEARGKIGALVIEQRRGGQYIRTKQLKKGLPSAKQKEKRKRYGQSVQAWRGLTDLEREEWNANAIIYKISGFNLFVKHFTAIYYIAIYGVGKYGGNNYG